MGKLTKVIVELHFEGRDEPAIIETDAAGIDSIQAIVDATIYAEKVLSQLDLPPIIGALH